MSKSNERILNEAENKEFQKYIDTQKKKIIDAAKWYAIHDLKIKKFDESGMKLTDEEIEAQTKIRIGNKLDKFEKYNK